MDSDIHRKEKTPLFYVVPREQYHQRHRPKHDMVIISVYELEECAIHGVFCSECGNRALSLFSGLFGLCRESFPKADPGVGSGEPTDHSPVAV